MRHQTAVLLIGSLVLTLLSIWKITSVNSGDSIPLPPFYDTLAINVHTPGKYYPHYPAFYKFREYKRSIEEKYVYSFDGLKRPKDADCLPGADAGGMGYYDVVTSRALECDEHTAAIKLHKPYYIPPLPHIDEEYVEWIPLFESIFRAKDKFVMMEIGARWGTWSMRAANIIRQLELPLDYNIAMIEPVEKYLQWINETLKINDIVNATVYPQYASKENVADYINRFDKIDLIDMDIQAAENQLVPEIIDLLDEKVVAVEVGTHSKEIFNALFVLFVQRGWEPVVGINSIPYNPCDDKLRARDYTNMPECLNYKSEYGPIYIRDGQLYVLNPKFKEPTTPV